MRKFSAVLVLCGGLIPAAIQVLLYATGPRTGEENLGADITSGLGLVIGGVVVFVGIVLFVYSYVRPRN